MPYGLTQSDQILHGMPSWAGQCLYGIGLTAVAQVRGPRRPGCPIVGDTPINADTV